MRKQKEWADNRIVMMPSSSLLCLMRVHVRIVGTARNTNQRSTSPAVTTDPVTAESAETTTPVATKSDMITNQAAT